MKKLAARRGMTLFPVSSATGEGIEKLILGLAGELRRLRAEAEHEVPAAAFTDAARFPEGEQP